MNFLANLVYPPSLSHRVPVPVSAPPWCEESGAALRKAAGGVRTAEDAALYYTIVEEILGPEWLNTDMFRIGASSAANNLLSAIEGREIKYY